MQLTDLKRTLPDAMGPFKRRFPNTDESTILGHLAAPNDVARHLAEAHDLTELEAQEELKDWMMLQSLARDAMAAGIDDDDLLPAG